MKTLFRVKTWQNERHIGFNAYTFWGFIGHKKGFANKWFTSLIPFSSGKAAWHFLGFRFTKDYGYVSLERNEINGWHTTDYALVDKLRNL